MGLLNTVHLVELPTNCSWLNDVERLLALIQKDVLANSNYNSAKEIKAAIRKYVAKTFPEKI
jgi:transposase